MFTGRFLLLSSLTLASTLQSALIDTFDSIQCTLQTLYLLNLLRIPCHCLSSAILRWTPISLQINLCKTHSSWFETLLLPCFITPIANDRLANKPLIPQSALLKPHTTKRPVNIYRPLIKILTMVNALFWSQFLRTHHFLELGFQIIDQTNQSAVILVFGQYIFHLRLQLRLCRCFTNFVYRHQHRRW